MQKTWLRMSLGACFGLSGATSLALEVVWGKELSYLLGNSTYAAATVVAAFMSGLALGSFLVARRRLRIERPIRIYGLMQFAIGIFGIFSVLIFRQSDPLFALLYNWLGSASQLFLVVRFLVVFVLMVIPVTLMGMTLPIVVSSMSGPGQPRYEVNGGSFTV